MEFREKTKFDAQVSLSQELDKLRITGNLPETQAKDVDKEFDGFKRLFANFLASDAKEAVNWEEIERLPKDAVSIKTLEHYSSLISLSIRYA